MTLRRFAKLDLELNFMYIHIQSRGLEIINPKKNMYAVIILQSDCRIAINVFNNICFSF